MNKLHIVFLLFILYANRPWEDPLLALHGDIRGRLQGWEDHLQAFPGTPGPVLVAFLREVIIKGK